jgi:hypothetical protein
MNAAILVVGGMVLIADWLINGPDTEESAG